MKKSEIRKSKSFLKSIKNYVFLGLTAFTLGFFACNKDSKNVLNDSNNLVNQIDILGQKYKMPNPSKGISTLDNEDLTVYTTSKRAKLALADAIGAGIGSSAGIWGALWGGFGLSLSLEPSLRESLTKKNNSDLINPSSTETNSQLFDYGILGDGHNVLMHQAYLNDLDASITSNHINPNLADLLINTSFNQLPMGNNSMEDLFNLHEPLIIDVITAGYAAHTSQDIGAIVNNSNLSLETKAIINEVTTVIIQNKMITGNNFTNFLNDVEELVKSEDLNLKTKTEILYFLAVANSSMHYWKQNFPN